MSTAPPRNPDARKRNRTMLIALFVMFFGSMLIAGLLRFSGWQPEGMKNHGELLQPPADLRDAAPRTTAGSEYRWQPHRRVEIAPFFDVGNVHHDWDSLFSGGMKTGYGIGFRVVSSKRVFARLDIGVGGNEGKQILFKLNESF